MGLLKTTGLSARTICCCRPFGKDYSRRMPKNYSKYETNSNKNSNKRVEKTTFKCLQREHGNVDALVNSIKS